MATRPNIPLERYKYTISDIILTADGFEEPITIRKDFIRSFSQINDYDNAISPKIMLSFQVEKEFYEPIILNMNTLVATFTISKIFVGAITESNDLASDDIEQEHVWREITLKAVNDDNISTGNANKILEDEVYKDESIDNSQQTAMINLLLYDNSNIAKYRKNNYYIINGSKNDVLYNFLKDRSFTNILMSSTDNAGGIYAIPYGHMGDNLASLNNLYGIYTTPYLFFMDLDTIYLLEKGKVGSTLKKDELKTVSIYLEKESTGTFIDNGSYTDTEHNMYILNTSNFEICDNDSTMDYAVGGRLKTVIGGTGEVKEDKFGDYDVERTVFVDNALQHNQIVYSIKEQRRSIILTFGNIDLSIVTPNKKYTLLPDESFYNSKYQIKGDYRLSKMMLFIRRTADDEMSSSVQLYLNKIPD